VIHHLHSATKIHKPTQLDMEQIKDFSQYKQAISCDGIAVLEGYATWCTHCKSMEPVVDEVRDRITVRWLAGSCY